MRRQKPSSNWANCAERAAGLFAKASVKADWWKCRDLNPGVHTRKDWSKITSFSPGCLERAWHTARGWVGRLWQRRFDNKRLL